MLEVNERPEYGRDGGLCWECYLLARMGACIGLAGIAWHFDTPTMYEINRI